jgi:replication factor A2
VAQVRNVSNQTTHISYKVDDGTGTIEVKHWTDSDDETERPRIDDNAYVRVWGKISRFNNKKHVGTHFVRPITNMNEISYHLLEATVVHLHFTRGPPGGKETNGTSGTGAGHTNGATMSGGDNLPPTLSRQARAIYQCLKTTPQSNEGLHTLDIGSRLQMDSADIAKGGEELVENGLIYSTVDEQTWAILNTGGY